MNSIPSIDLHPEKVGGQGPEAAVRACRAFLEQCLSAGRRQARIITGLGLRGDGTPRLRMRIEQDVLPAYARSIEQQGYEQGGAVIHLWLKAQAQAPSSAWKRHQRHVQERAQVAGREERLMVAYDRLDAAALALEEGDLRRFRLKLNQVAKEFGWQALATQPSQDTAEKALAQMEKSLKELDG